MSLDKPHQIPCDKETATHSQPPRPSGDVAAPEGLKEDSNANVQPDGKGRAPLAGSRNPELPKSTALGG
jgi:hypothetical protein